MALAYTVQRFGIWKAPFSYEPHPPYWQKYDRGPAFASADANEGARKASSVAPIVLRIFSRDN